MDADSINESVSQCTKAGADAMEFHTSGFFVEQVEAILDETKEIPVLFMTAYPTPEIKKQVLKMGAKGCISKPFISIDFEQTIEQQLFK